MPKVSVIVPVYKTGKYLDKCVKSLLAQSYPDYELLLVDDGSPDDCGQRCEGYAKKYSHVRALHKENGGLSSARNYGVDYAQGEYVTFVDSDDYVDEGMLGYLVARMDETNADIAVCGIYDEYDSETTAQWEETEEFTCGGEELYRYILEGRKVAGSSCAKLYRRGLFDKVRMPEGMLYEDAYFLSEAVRHIERAAISTASFYHYVHHAGSITTSRFRSCDMDVIKAYRHNLEIIGKHFPQLKPQGEFRYLWAHFVVLDRILQREDYREVREYPKTLRFLRRHTLRVVFCKYFRLTRRAGALVLLFSVRAYRRLAIAQVARTIED